MRPIVNRPELRAYRDAALIFFLAMSARAVADFGFGWRIRWQWLFSVAVSVAVVSALHWWEERR